MSFLQLSSRAQEGAQGGAHGMGQETGNATRATSTVPGTGQCIMKT